ncbi:MAG: C1 family peptidase [Rikenellaceae bacterium]
MKKSLLSLTLILSTGSLFAQTLLGEAELKEIRGSFVKNANTVAIQNILTSDKDIKNKTKNWDVNGKVDHYFKYRINVKGITNQYNSGRCWMFTSMNVLRPSVMEKFSIDAFDFSHNYSYFWDVLEKANLFLENIIATAHKDMDDREVVTFFTSPVEDGGVWNLFYNVAEKYGVVPQSVMPESEHANNTGQMMNVLNERLRAGGYTIRELAKDNNKGETEEKAMRAEKTAVLKDVYRILALCLGEPPAEFTWRYKNKDGQVKSLTTTPKEFYKSIVPENYNPMSYIMVMNDPTREYYKIYEIKNYRNTIEGINWVYLNLPNDEIKASALASIKNNEPLYASCDVGKQMDRENGILDMNNYNYEALFGIDLKMDKKARILTRQSGSSHAMLLIACDTDENEVPVKWEFENSWGATSGHNGYMTLTDEWFSQYLFRVVINKNYLSSKAINALNQKPVLLPVWDYMF